MNENTQDFLEEIKNNKLKLMSNVYRHSTLDVIKKETIAEHSLEVCLYSYIIAKKCKLNNNICYKIGMMGAIHDLEESHTNDTPSVIKKAVPEVKEGLKKAGKYTINKYYSEFSQLFFELEESETKEELEGTIVKIADISSFIFKMDRELTLGNRSIEIIKAKEKSERDLEKRLKKLKQLLFNYFTTFDNKGEK